MMRKLALMLAGLLAVTLGGQRGLAQSGPAVEFGFGFTSLSLREPLLDSSGSAGVLVGFSFSPSQNRPELRLGFNLVASSYDEDTRIPLPPQPELFVVTGHFSELHLVTPEVRLSWRQPLESFFIEPGVGLGLVVVRYEAGDRRLGAFGQFDEVLIRQTRTALGVRPMVRAGYNFDQWDFGIEASYLISRVRVGDQRRLREFYIGAFARWFLH